MSKTLEELGYEKTEYETQTEYTYDHKIMGERFEHEILFSKPSKLVFIYGKRGIDMEELKAIYKYCEEQGWINE
jgi:hypothetical protein